MSDTSTPEATETEPATHEAFEAAKHELRKDAERLEQAKSALVHGVESVVEKFTDAVSSIGGRK
jgi:exonuclease VII small subunit